MGTHTDTGWEWNLLWRKPLFDSEIDMAANFLSDIDGNRVQPHIRDDWVWKANPTGQYSAQRQVFEEVWKLKIPSKTSFFGWRLIRDRLPTKTNLRRRHVQINDVLCPFCRNNDENAAHQFFQCSKILPLWWESLFWVNIVGAFPQNPRQHFLQHVHGQDARILSSRWKCWWTALT